MRAKAFLVLTLYFSQSPVVWQGPRKFYTPSPAEPTAASLMRRDLRSGRQSLWCDAGWRRLQQRNGFELSPSKDGWTETVLYSFTGGPMEVSRLAA